MHLEALPDVFPTVEGRQNEYLFLFEKESHTLFRKFEMEMHCFGAPAAATSDPADQRHSPIPCWGILMYNRPLIAYLLACRTVAHLMAGADTGCGYSQEDSQGIATLHTDMT